MKKISVLIIMALIVTIGGVYATWNYAQSAASADPVQSVVTLTDKVVDTPKGTIEVDASGLIFEIDDTNGDYVAELVVDGEIEITFTPADGADENVAQHGIALQYVLSVTENWKYEGTQIFTVDTNPVVLNNGNATLTATIDADEIASMITLGNISLPTADDYDAFEEILKNGGISITVSEVQ